MFNAADAKNACVKWIAQWFENNGKDCNAVIRVDNHATRLAELLREKGLFYYW